MKPRTRWRIVGILAWVLLGFLIGRATYDGPSYFDGDYASLSDEDVEFGLEVYRMCMRSAGETGCRMSVENFRVYHGLNAEADGRRQ